MSWGHRGGRSDWEKGGSGHFGGEEQWPNRERGNRRHSDRYDNQGHHGQGGHDRWKHDKYERRGGGHGGYNDRRPRGHWDNGGRGGSWGNSDRKRDRSRSPPRYNRNDDSKWPSMEERESNISNQRHQRYDNHHHQHYDQPKTTLQITGVPQSVTAEMIKATLEMKQVFVRSCQLASTREPGEWSGIGYIEMGRVQDASFIVEECKGELLVNGNRIHVAYADTTGIGGQQQNNYGQVQQYQNHHHHHRRHFPAEPTDTMIVRGLEMHSDEKTIAEAFGYITKKNILDIRLARDRGSGASRGFAFITWESVADCKQVLEYLQKATPKFNIDGQVVALDYANGLPNKSHELKAKAANDAIAAAQSIKKAWTDPNSLTNGRGALMKTAASDKGIAPHQTPHLYPHLPADIGSQAPPQGMIPPIPPDQIPPLTDSMGRYRKYPNPNYSLFQWFQAHQMYYDPSTGLMWDPNSQYFYNQYKQLYLYWDETQDTFVPVANQQNHQPVANPIQHLPGEATMAEQGKKTKAVDIQKQMESWMKQQKKTKNKPMSAEEANEIRKQKKLDQVGKFAPGSFGSTFQSKSQQQAQLPPPPPPVEDDIMKTPPPSPPRAKQSPVKEPKHETSTQETSYTDEETYLDWKTFKCLLCRRAFSDEPGLQKHVNKSKLHKENLEKLKHPDVEEDEDETEAYKEVMRVQEAMGANSYRDRAKERRTQFGDGDVPGGERSHIHEDYTGPTEQPTVNGLGQDNVGAQLLQKMGYTMGSGLGKHGQGIVNPIEAGQVRENKTAGLGVKATSRMTPRAGKGEQYKKKIRQLTQDRWNDAGHG